MQFTKNGRDFYTQGFLGGKYLSGSLNAQRKLYKCFVLLLGRVVFMAFLLNIYTVSICSKTHFLVDPVLNLFDASTLFLSRTLLSLFLVFDEMLCLLSCSSRFCSSSLRSSSLIFSSKASTPPFFHTISQISHKSFYFNVHQHACRLDLAQQLLERLGILLLVLLVVLVLHLGGDGRLGSGSLLVAPPLAVNVAPNKQPHTLAHILSFKILISCYLKSHPSVTVLKYSPVGQVKVCATMPSPAASRHQ